MATAPSPMSTGVEAAGRRAAASCEGTTPVYARAPKMTRAGDALPGARSRQLPAARLETDVDSYEGAGAAQVDLVAAEVVAHVLLRPQVAALGRDREVVVDGQPQPGHRVHAAGRAGVDEVVGDDVEV